MNLQPLPDDFIETRDALHQVAFFAVAPSRYRSTGRMGLSAAPGGFGTPRFDGKVARVEGDTLVFETDDAVASQAITTVRAAARFFGVEYEVDWFDGEFHDPLQPVDPDTELRVSDTAARAIGQWFNFGTEVLERLRSHDPDATEVQLWPEHFDPATELGDQESGGKASYGASPGDSANPEPYLYVSPWSSFDTSNDFWNASGFEGASLGYAELLDQGDPVQAGVDFLLEGYRALTG